MSGFVPFLSPTTVILALAHSGCLMSRRVMAENEMKGNESFGGEKGREELWPRNSNWLVDGVLEISLGLWLLSSHYP